jgi:iron complex outermembrane receptor protein
MIKNLYWVLAILCISNIATAQECTVIFKGSVKDFHDGTPLTGATIQVEGTKKYAAANSNGDFVLKGLCKKTYWLIVSHVGCDTRRVQIDAAKERFKEIRLEHHIEQLNEITVTSEGAKQTKTAQESVLKTDILERFSSQSLGDAIKEIPGVSSINTGNSIVKPVINGMYGSRLIIMNSGVRLQDQEWGIEHAPSIDINSANQISVIKGSGALAYGGDAIGGVIVLNPARTIAKDTLFGKTILGGQSNGRGYNVSSWVNKNYSSGWFAQLQATYRRNGDFNAPDYNLSNTGLDSKGLSFRIGKKNFESGFEVYYSFLDNEIGILAASHIGSSFNLLEAINSGQPALVRDFTYDIVAPKQEITHHLIKASYFKRFKSFGKLDVQYDYQNNQRLEFDVRIGDRRNIPAIDLTLQTHSLLADVTVDTNADRKLNFGLMARFQENFADPDTGVRRLIPDYDKYDFGAYITTERRLNDHLLVDAGIRYDFNRIDAKKFYRLSRWIERGYDQDFADIVIEELPTQLLTNPVFNYHNISASAGIRYDLNDRSYILGNYSLASRPPNPSELFSDGLHHSAARFELGDLRFDQEVSNRISATYGYNSEKFRFLTEVFYNRVRDYMYLRPIDFLITIRGPFPIWAYEQTDAELFGFDVSATYDISDAWQWQSKLAFIKGYDTETDLALIDMPPFSTTNQITYTNKRWHNFSASLKSEWVFEQNEFPDFNFDITEQLTGNTFLVDISTPPSAFHLLHFYSEANFDVGEKSSLNVTLGVNNLLDTSYRNYLNRLRFFADELGRNVTVQLQFNY